MTFAFATNPRRRVHIVAAAGLDAALSALPDAHAELARLSGFKAETGQRVSFPDGDVLYGAGAAKTPFAAGDLAMALPEDDYALANTPEGWDPTLTAIAIGLGSYAFNRYRKPKRNPARIAAPEGADAAEALRVVAGVSLTRDLINTPAEDMGPSALEAAVRGLAEAHGASARAVVGEDLISENYPMIHAVGRAAADAPRLIELEWGDPAHPRLALVGKGVCFDSGGLDLKPAEYMRLMKKDMGGAASVLGLASMIMDAGLKVRLHVLIPAVENAVSGDAFRPGDILNSRKGLTVEIDNTDAEGRLVLADALTRACEDKPELVIDMATLTGAARIAMGPSVSPVFTAADDLAAAVQAAGEQVDDPVWRLPLVEEYDRQLDGDISDLVNTGDGPMAGCITAALFLQRFVEAPAWMHCDVFGWTPKARPGRPKGGELLAGRALYQALKQRFPA